MKWSGCFIRSESGLLCQYCGNSLQYDFSNGEHFIEDNDKLPRSFRILKYDVKRHMQSNKHIINSKQYFAEQQKYAEIEEAGKVNALNCANAAYFIYKMDMSYESYEKLICVMHNSGCDVGIKNHSKEFPRLFLPLVHSVLRREITTFITSSDLPVGIIADKVTTNHRSRHIIVLRVSIFDINKKNLFQSIYLEHNFVNDFSGKGLSSSILITLDKFGFDAQFLRKNLVGLAVDGQYINLGVANHMEQELCLTNDLASWDMMHRIELMQKHSEMPDVVTKAHNLIHEAMKEFMHGLKYESLLKCSEEFSEFFYKPKIFKTMKFASHSMAVFTTFIKDYKFLVSACEQNEDMFSLRDKLLSKSAILNILLQADIYNMLSRYSKCVQLNDNLPWEYDQIMDNLGSDLVIFLRYIDAMICLDTTEDLCEFFSNLPSSFFKHTQTASEIFMSCTYQGVPLPDLPVSAKHLRSTKCTILNVNSQLSENYNNDIQAFGKFITSLINQFSVYTNRNENLADSILKKVGRLFNFDYLIFPRTNVPIQHLFNEFTSETFFDFVKDMPFHFHDVDKSTFFFNTNSYVCGSSVKFLKAEWKGHPVI